MQSAAAPALTPPLVAYRAGTAEIVETLAGLIDAATETIILQMYLFAANGDLSLLFPRPGAEPHADRLCDLLIAKKRAAPHVDIIVVLDTNTPADPHQTRRRGTLIRDRLLDAGIQVLSAYLFNNRFDARRSWFPAKNLHLQQATAGPQDWVGLQNRWQFFHNVEDHRKNLVIDGGRAGAIMSHNLFDAAYDWHENLLYLEGAPASQLWHSATRAVQQALTLPHPDAEPSLSIPPATPTPSASPQAALLENTEIRPALEAMFAEASEGDQIDVATTYFSDLPMLRCLEAAARRGARVRVLIDNVSALPLPQPHAWFVQRLVNREVVAAAVRLRAELPHLELRIHDSSAGRMMHLKTAARRGAQPLLIGGQANYTPNSFSGAWLETVLQTSAPAALEGFQRQFEGLWNAPEARPLSPLSWAGRLGDAGLALLARILGLFGLRP